MLSLQVLQITKYYQLREMDLKKKMKKNNDRNFSDFI